MGDATQAALTRLYRGLGQRDVMADDPRGRAIMDRRLVPTLEKLTQRLVPEASSALQTPPPRRIAVAMALAIFSQPHLSTTFRGPGSGDRPVRALPPLVATNEVLESALGLSTWELDDLREEVDRRAGGVLKQTTLVNWLTARYPDGSKLFPLLFPGADGVDNPTIVQCGAHLYAMVDGVDTEPGALFLPWLQSTPATGLSPLTAFRGRYVDAGLKAALARGIGANADEISDLLERTLTMIPRDQSEAFLVRDRWRNEGCSAVTSLGHAYPRMAWLTREVNPEDLQWKKWLKAGASGASLTNPIAPFDTLTKTRVHHTLEALYTDLLARLYADPAGERSTDEIDRYDLGAQVRAVLDPLLRWTRSKSSATWLARATGVSPDEAQSLLAQLHSQWSDRSIYWTQPTVEQFTHSVLAKWVSTLACLDGTLRHLLAEEPDPRWNHRDVLFLFAAHYITEAPADRALLAHGIDPASPGMAIGRWFTPTWRRVLDAIEDEAQSTNAEFAIPDGLF